MPWLVLLLSSVCEAVWATALGQTHGFTRLWPSVIFVVAIALSMAGLAIALRRIPLGTAYAVWTGVGAALTVIYAMASGTEPVSVAKIIFLTGIIGAVIGLKLVGSKPVSSTTNANTSTGDTHEGH